jgi:hypothetical protein
MFMLSRWFLLCLLVLLFVPAVAAARPAPDGDWLTGAWTLCEDPDGSPADALLFMPDGSGSVIRPKGSLSFAYKQTGRAVSLQARVGDRTVPIELQASPEYDKLVLHSESTGNDSFYVRSERIKAFRCSAK